MESNWNCPWKYHVTKTACSWNAAHLLFKKGYGNGNGGVGAASLFKSRRRGMECVASVVNSFLYESGPRNHIARCSCVLCACLVIPWHGVFSPSPNPPPKLRVSFHRSTHHAGQATRRARKCSLREEIADPRHARLNQIFLLSIVQEC